MVLIKGNRLIVEGFKCDRGAVKTQEIDLTPYQGKFVRVYLDDNLKLIVNSQHDCYWHLCEMEIPSLQANTIIDEKSGEEIRVEPESLDLNKIDIRHFDLPKEE